LRIHLAGLEKVGFITSCGLSGHKYGLMSYYHFSRNPPKERVACIELINSFGMEMIVDSGLFTMMFGSGKGQSYDLPFMIEYTKKYLEEVRSYGIKNMTVVECDVHKIIGMDAVFELRKVFADSGLQTIYVWHAEETIDGLMRLAESVDYMALSIPELRILFKGRSHRYQSAVFDLLGRIKVNGRVPKIHLLGNTVEETMKARAAYSCDSTSWLAGVRYGEGLVYRQHRILKANIRSKSFVGLKDVMREQKPEAFERIYAMSTSDTMKEYLLNTFVSAESFRRYQEYLDSIYPWEGLCKTA
jgi:hypothetical protein